MNTADVYKKTYRQLPLSVEKHECVKQAGSYFKAHENCKNRYRAREDGIL